VIDGKVDMSYCLTLSISVIFIAYGTIYLGGLDVIFLTRIEKLLWQVSRYHLIGFAGPEESFPLSFSYLLACRG
jgi:hypothetical protein